MKSIKSAFHIIVAVLLLSLLLSACASPATVSPLPEPTASQPPAATTPDEAAERFLNLFFTVSNYDIYNAYQTELQSRMQSITPNPKATTGIRERPEIEGDRMVKAKFTGIADDACIESMLANRQPTNLEEIATENGCLFSVGSVKLEETSEEQALLAYVFTLNMIGADTKTKESKTIELVGMINVKPANGTYIVTDFKCQNLKNLFDKYPVK